MSAQTVPSVIVKSVGVEGNRKTKTRIITRELTFSIGDTIPLSKFGQLLENNRLRVMNTNLFNVVQFNVKDWKSGDLPVDEVNLVISVVENFFVYPVPIFSLADRNFNVWWKEQNHSFARTNYGFSLQHINTTGQRDPFSATLQLGYTPRFSMSYEVPYINKKQTVGLLLGGNYGVNRELTVATIGNKQSFFRNPEQHIFQNLGIVVGAIITPGLLSRHSISLSYSRQSVDTSVVSRNQDYYLDKRNKQRYLLLNYNYSHDTRDMRPYPLKGHLAVFSASKSGLLPTDDVNLLNISARWAQFGKITPRLSYETVAKGRFALINGEQPYSFTQGMGYGTDYLRGFEYYVVDGVNFGILKNSLHFQLFDKTFDLSPYLKLKILKGFHSLPVKLYLSGNFDMGYAQNLVKYSAQNPLNNRVLRSGGLGLDIVAFYSWVWQIQYSWNDLGEKDLFIHYKTGF
ncbi:MAG: BamA/TamA family outer membrane protein [Saprospiraceae bacterium]|nr:BamA/TamA family outer membrane protein [Saprospiraceae bacterium]